MRQDRENRSEVKYGGRHVDMSGERQRPGFRDGLTLGGSLCLDAAGSKQGRDKAKRVATRFSAELWAKCTMTSVSAEAKWAGGCEFLVECRTWPRRESRLSHADRPGWRRAECTGAQQRPRAGATARTSLHR